MRQDAKHLVSLDLQTVKEDELRRVRKAGGEVADEHFLKDFSQYRASHHYPEGHSDPRGQFKR